MFELKDYLLIYVKESDALNFVISLLRVSLCYRKPSTFTLHSSETPQQSTQNPAQLIKFTRIQDVWSQ
jgi:hypothetical protein